jgi:hypothetical protein
MIGDICADWNKQISTLNAWTAPALKMSALGAYVMNSTSWQSSWDESEIGGDWDPSTDTNYVSTYKKIHDSM